MVIYKRDLLLDCFSYLKDNEKTHKSNLDAHVKPKNIPDIYLDIYQIVSTIEPFFKELIFQIKHSEKINHFIQKVISNKTININTEKPLIISFVNE